ncbi:MAG: FprA family A-type flavoprotein [Desulfovibrio sp.]|jgi:flavorubredoxin|nr:FprA family A-type flavoprotein [Desulfovibrio sp.]
MQPLSIANDVFWLGDIDFESRDFHGYSRSPLGTTYNAYLIKDEKNALFDTVKEGHGPILLEKLRQVLPPEKVDYIVVNHLEPDHSGALPLLMEACRPEALICSPLGKKSLEGHFGSRDWPVRVVTSGETLSLGGRSVRFIEARMLHWPDSMFSYIPEEKLLISNDAFGQNIASTARFADEVEPALLRKSLSEYYHNIILPYSAQVLKILDAIAGQGLSVEILAPDHGLIFRRPQDVASTLEAYRDFALQRPRKRALIIYDTMWRSTERMAHALCRGLADNGVETVVLNLKQNHHSAVMTELAACGLLAVGSPTHNNGILPLVAASLTYLKGLRPKNRIGAAFGSYGWSGENTKILGEYLSAMDMPQPVDPLKCPFVPDAAVLNACEAMGASLAAALEKHCAAACS